MPRWSSDSAVTVVTGDVVTRVANSEPVTTISASSAGAAWPWLGVGVEGGGGVLREGGDGEEAGGQGQRRERGPRTKACERCYA